MATKIKRSPLLRGGLLLGLGLGYAAFGSLTGLWLPCPFLAVTGWYCPGCGVTRLCLSLLRLDFPAAWRANPALLCCLPVLAGLLLSIALRRKRTGAVRLSRGQNAVTWGLAAVMIAFGVLRNLPGVALP